MIRELVECISNLKDLEMRVVAVGARMLCKVAIAGCLALHGTALAGHEDHRAELWQLPLPPFEPSAGLLARPAACLAPYAEASSDCSDRVAFSFGGPIAQTSWMSNAWAWSRDYWYMLAAPVPLAFVGGGGGGGGGGAVLGAPQSDGPSFPEEPMRPGGDPKDPYSPPPSSPVPEPEAWALFAVGGAVLAVATRRKRGSR